MEVSPGISTKVKEVQPWNALSPTCDMFSSVNVVKEVQPWNADEPMLAPAAKLISTNFVKFLKESLPTDFRLSAYTAVMFLQPENREESMEVIESRCTIFRAASFANTPFSKVLVFGRYSSVICPHVLEEKRG